MTKAAVADNEEWRIVGGHPYEVSSRGGVRRIGGRPLRPRLHSNGYHRVSLGARNDAYVHRLVARAFHGEPPAPDYHADHRDGDRTNNSSENLRWLSPQENRALRNFARGERSGQARLTEAQVQTIRCSSASNAALAVEMGVAPRTIRDVRNGQSWGHI